MHYFKNSLYVVCASRRKINASPETFLLLYVRVKLKIISLEGRILLCLLSYGSNKVSSNLRDSTVECIFFLQACIQKSYSHDYPHYSIRICRYTDHLEESLLVVFHFIFSLYFIHDTLIKRWLLQKKITHTKTKHKKTDNLVAADHSETV